jgi:hypothetical protein
MTQDECLKLNPGYQTKAAFNKKTTFFTSKFGLKLQEETDIKCYV